MEAEAAALLTTAGTTVVGLMTTDAWNQAHDELVHLWRRFRPDCAEAVGRELKAHRAAILVTQDSSGAATEVALGTLWAQELQALLAEPDAARELGDLLRTFTLTASGSSKLNKGPQSLRVEAHAKGHARSYAAGRDMTIVERTGDE